MKFTLNWLKDYLDTSASLAEICTTLTKIGLEVEGVQDYQEQLKQFIVAKIEAVSPHPNASKLQVCSVNDGCTIHQIVCGAANARAGLYVVLAREGVIIPGNGMVIKKTKIRDVESNGMLCSLEELALAESSEGIVELAGTPTLGSPAAAALGFDDAVIEIAITPNRGDCFGIYGIARDLAAAGIGTLKQPPLASSFHGQSFANPISITTNTTACGYFVGCSIRGVKNTESPTWLRNRLVAVGQRPISALVDITNYLLIAFGRPLHVYDGRALKGNLQARNARDGEALKTLNGEEYSLDASMCVIADDEKAHGIAGIMGGAASGCQLDTTDVFLESAIFDPISIANTGRKLGCLSDARQRFERGVDTGFVMRGAELARDLIIEICGGEASAFVEAGTSTTTQTVISFNPDKIQAITGVNIEQNTAEKILASLGFAVSKTPHLWSVTVPTWRHDVTMPEDLVEEIIRIYGYEHITLTPLPEYKNSRSSLPLLEQRAKKTRNMLAHHGFTELCSWSFVSEKQAQRFGGNNSALELLNPISSDLSVMRPSLLPHILSAAGRNSNKGNKNLALFEVGLVFHGTAPNEQQMMVSGLRTGTIEAPIYTAQTYSNKPREVDVFDAKADALAILQSLGVNVESLSITDKVPDYYHPSRSMALMLGGKMILGYAGELHPTIVADENITGRVAAFEILLQNIPEPKQKTTAKKSLNLPNLLPVERDFAFLVKDDVAVESIKRAIRKAEKQYISNVEVFDVYRGKGVESGYQSVALKVVLQPTDHTFTDDEIQAMSKTMVDSVAASCGASLRA